MPARFQRMKMPTLQPVVFLLLAGFVAKPGWASPDQLRQQVKPILARCVTCHSGPTPTGSLDLTSRESALQGGKSGPALVPGDSSGSLLYRMVSSGKMPPGDPLSPSQIETLRQWIDGEAPWGGELSSNRAGKDWWSLQPITSPPVPEARNREWIRNPVDAFILAKLEARGLSPSPAADPVTLIRRATYDLHGLPPTPEEIDAFVNDSTADAYENLLDRLLASPRYGERWGRHWLDVARFGESQGFERDTLREHAWRYRDFVIRSFNQDKPYRQFVTEQIAGDVLEPVTRDGIIATSFLILGPWDEVGSDQPSELMRLRIREEELEDIIGTVAQTFMGMTVNCARCHDHKFDPIPQRDYYRIKSVFDGFYHGNRSVLPHAEAENRDRSLIPLNKRVKSYYRKILALEQAARNKVLAGRGRPRRKKGLPVPIARWNFDVDGKDSVGQLHVKLPEGASIVNGRLRLHSKETLVRTPPLPGALREKTLEVWVSIADLEQKSARVMTVEQVDARIFDGITFGGGKAQWGTSSEYSWRSLPVDGPQERAKPEEVIHLAVVYSPDHRVTLYRNGAEYGSYRPETMGVKGQLQTFASGRTTLVFGRGGTTQLVASGLVGEIDEARLYDRALSPEEMALSFGAGAPSVPKDQLMEAMTGKQRKRRERLLAALAAAEEELKLFPPVPLAYAGKPRQPDPTYVLQRGDTVNRGEQVWAGGLSAVQTLPSDFGLLPDAHEGLRRMKLAEWIVHPENPLTARVMVNRLWHYHFGKGIVATPNDFGFNGAQPSHPELLDWLASRFLAEGWSVKKLHKWIMLSHSYRQSSDFREKAAQADGENRLLWRFTPRRLVGEAIRDAMLAVSGQLNLKMGGPSFRPFQVLITNVPFYIANDPQGAEYNRRTVYRMNVNSAQGPLLESLDCPRPSIKTPRRGVTTTPLQALSLMNNAFVVRQTDHFAQRLNREGGADPSQRITLAYRLAFGRTPDAAEIERASRFVAERGMKNFCWALLNANEFRYLE